MDDLVKIVNKKGVTYEVTRTLAEKMLKNGDIEHKDISEIEEEIENELTAEDVEDIEAIEEEIDYVGNYEATFKKPVPKNKKNDLEWIKKQLGL